MAIIKYGNKKMDGLPNVFYDTFQRGMDLNFENKHDNQHQVFQNYKTAKGYD